ncbi:MAG: hypothetical protein ACXWQR_14365 [Ktedonobacterales bacterium]
MLGRRGKHNHKGNGLALARGRFGVLLAAALLSLALVMLAACSPFGGGGTGSDNSNSVTLANTPWCDKPLINFQDDSTTSQATITQWEQVRDQLGFTSYLPKTLPKGSCLALAGGSIHDPIYGGHFSITYILPQTGPISFSEAPKRTNLSDKVQCTQETQKTQQGTPTPAAQPNTPSTVCIGAIAKTSITIAARQSSAEVEKLFSTLQANVEWVPVDTGTQLATATPS